MPHKEGLPFENINEDLQKMKTLIVVLVSLIVVMGCVRFPQKITPQVATVEKIETTKIPKGFKDFCEARNLVMVVFVDRSGKARARQCPGISLREDLPKGVNDPVGLPSTLGITQKWRKKNDPDPCIEWVVGGYPFYYCW